MRTISILFLSLFFFHFSFAQSWLWGNYGIGDGFVTSIASGEKGNCYITGLFPNDTIHFGGYTVRNSTVTNPPFSSDADAFLVKIDPNGNVLWAKQTNIKNSNPNLGVNNAPTVYTDNTGNIYLNSSFPDTLFVGAFMLTSIGYQGNCLAKFDSNGNALWAKEAACVNNSSFVSGAYISCDNYGNIYVTGAFSDTIRFGSYIIGGSSTIYFNAFLVKYDSGGNVKWVRHSPGLTSSSNDVSNCDVTDRFGNAFITGAFADTVQFGSYQLFSNNTGNFFLAKYDSSGNVKWAKQAKVTNSNGFCVGFGLATDQSGNIYATGDFQDTVIFDNDTLTDPHQQYQSSFFLVKYDSSGNVLWAEQATVLDNNNWNAWGLSIDNSKHLYLSANGGYGQCKVTFGGDTLSMNDTAKYDGASIVFKLDSNGQVVCSAIIPVGSSGNASTAIASDTSGKYVYSGGIAVTTVIFSDDTINPFSFPPNVILGGNEFPFVARWEECDPNITTAVIQNKNPIGQVILYPNPNNGTFTITLQNVNEPAQVEIYDVLGEEIYQAKINSNNTKIDLGSQPEGVYFYRVVKEDGGLVGCGKMIIEK